MTKSLAIITFLLSFLIVLTSARRSRRVRSRRCQGSATYKLVFKNVLTPERFGSRIPADGLVFSPVLAASHSKSVALIKLRRRASPEVENMAETGNNGPLGDLARSLIRNGKVRDVQTAMGPTMPGETTVLNVTVDCQRPLITMTGMIAPSPDWIVQVANRNMFDRRKESFIKACYGRLVAYDAGTDSGNQFTDPADASLDEPTVPAGPIRPLVEDETDRFDGETVGLFLFKRIQ